MHLSIILCFCLAQRGGKIVNQTNDRTPASAVTRVSDYFVTIKRNVYHFDINWLKAINKKP